MARLDLLAHGATAATRAARFPDDEGLEPSAREKLQTAGVGFGRYDRVLTSPARAARETALALGRDAEIDEALRDCDYGRWRGVATTAIAESESSEFVDWLANPDAAPHGGETVRMLIARMSAWLEIVAADDRATLAVTHASIVRAAIVAAVGAGAESFWRFDIAPLTLVRLSGRDRRWNLTLLRRFGA